MKTGPMVISYLGLVLKYADTRPYESRKQIKDHCDTFFIACHFGDITGCSCIDTEWDLWCGEDEWHISHSLII